MKNAGWIIFFVLFFEIACENNSNKNKDHSNGKIVSEWNSKLTATIVQDLFTPPVAARIYSYPNLAAYEILKFSDAKNQSITARLKGFDSIPFPPDLELDLSLSALKAFTTVALKLVYTENVLNDYYQGTIDSLIKNGMSAELIERSEKYGMTIADIILKRASKDMFKETRGMERYVLKKTPGSWETTPLDFMKGVEPDWNLIYPFALDSCSSFREDTPIAFSEDKNSEFYKTAIEVMNTSNSLDSERIEIAKYWDDNPNVSKHFGHAKIFDQKMTPGGHWMAITANAVKHKKLNQAEAAHAFSIVAVSLMDGFIACWDAKYYYSTVRPITYIQKLMDPDWNSFLQNPPFPEFPSGHATVSASAASVLTNLFGDNYSFTDSSQVEYGLPVRSFNSFFEASDEAAMSRLYGGIHFRQSNEAGKNLGRKVGKNLIEKLNRSRN